MLPQSGSGALCPAKLDPISGPQLLPAPDPTYELTRATCVPTPSSFHGLNPAHGSRLASIPQHEKVLRWLCCFVARIQGLKHRELQPHPSAPLIHAPNKLFSLCAIPLVSLFPCSLVPPLFLCSPHRISQRLVSLVYPSPCPPLFPCSLVPLFTPCSLNS